MIGESHSVDDDRDAEDELVIEDLFAASTNCVAKRLGFNEMRFFSQQSSRLQQDAYASADTLFSRATEDKLWV